MKGYINLTTDQSLNESTEQSRQKYEKHSVAVFNQNTLLRQQTKCSACKIVVSIIVFAIVLTVGISAYSLEIQKQILTGLTDFLQLDQISQDEQDTLSQISNQNKQLIENQQQNMFLQKQRINQTLLEEAEEPVIKIKSQNFSIPKYIWIFVQTVQNQSYFVQLCIKNIRWFAQKSGFQVRLINSSNYAQWIDKDRKKKLQDVIGLLDSQKDSNDLKKKVKIQLIMMEILLNNGGIVIDKNIILTEDFHWLERINDNIYVNRARKDSKAQYFGFFNIDFGPFFSKANKKVKYQTERYMIKFPGMLSIFLAGVAKGQYLKQVMPWFYQIVENPSMAEILMNKYNIFAGNITGKDPYNEAFVIACQIVLQTKQKQFNIQNQNQTVYAIDYYGLLTINSRYFPTKIEAVFERAFEQKVYKNLAKYSLIELEQSAGPQRYMVSLLFQQHMNYRLQRARDGNSYYYMHPDSFFARFFFMDAQYTFIWKDYQKPIVNITAKRWQSLPKIIWLFWDTGISHSTLANKLCVQNIRKYGEQVGFQIRMVNNSNIGSYIGHQNIERIDNIAQSRKIQIFAPMKSNFYRIALMAKYGGIYMDVSFFLAENLNWLLDIARYPSQFIFNRYGQLPKIFMFFHPHYGSMFQWVYDGRFNTKMAWLLSYQNNLIVSEPNQKLIQDWYNNYEQFITSSYEDSQKLMKEVDVYQSRWTSWKHTYLASMESLRITLGLKQKEIKLRPASPYGPQSAPQYYGVWCMSGFRGQQKFRPHTNYDKNNFRDPYSYDNFFLYRYSKEYADGVIGKVHEMGKFYRWTIRHLTQFIEQNIDNEFREEAHPDSYFMKFIYDRSRLRIERRGKELVIVT